MAQPPKKPADPEEPEPDGTGRSDHEAADPTAAEGTGAVIGRQRGPAAGGGLSDLERRILAFEKRSWNPQDRGPKDRAIREEFDLSPTRYGQILHALLDNPAAISREPVLVNRLRRLRELRAAARGGGTG